MYKDLAISIKVVMMEVTKNCGDLKTIATELNVYLLSKFVDSDINVSFFLKMTFLE